MGRYIWVNISSGNGLLPEDNIAITWINFGISSKVLCGIKQKAASQEVSENIFCKVFRDNTFKITTTSPRGQWVKRLMSLLFVFFHSGGPDYAQVFNQFDIGAPVDVFRMSSDRSVLLTDHLTSTCMSLSEHLHMNHILIKVLPSRDYLFKRYVIVHVAGKGFSCSPTDTTTVYIQPTCADEANCTNVLPCISLRGYQAVDLTVCGFRCQTLESLDYALVYFTANDLHVAVQTNLELCEIWFSNL